MCEANTLIAKHEATYREVSKGKINMQSFLVLFSSPINNHTFMVRKPQSANGAHCLVTSTS